MKAIRRFIQICEESNIGFGLWIATALSIIFIRNSLEILVTTGSFPLITPFNLLHFPIWFLTVLLSIIILLHFLTKEDIVRVSKVSLIFFAIIIFPALLDFISALMTKSRPSYEYVQENVGQVILNLFNPFFKISGVPYSLRIEMLIVCIFSFFYIQLKRNKIFISLLGAFLVFVICAIHGALPGLLEIGFIKVGAFFLRVTRPFFSNRVIEGVVNESVVVMVELFFTVLTAAIWVWLYDRRKFRAILKDFRLSRYLTCFILLALGIGLNLYQASRVDGFIIIRISGLFMVIFFALRFSSVVNDIFDLDCDRISNPNRPLPAGIINKKEYLNIGIIYLVFSLLFAIWVSEICFMVTLFFISIYFLYSVPPFRLKRFFILSSLVTGVQALLILLIGQVSLVNGDTVVLLYPPFLWLVFLIFFLSSNIKDLKDIEGDRLCNVYSLPVVFGESKSRKIIAFLVFLSYLAVPLFLNRFFYDFKAAIISFAFGLSSYFYIKKEESGEGPVFLLFFVYILIVFLFLL